MADHPYVIRFDFSNENIGSVLEFGGEQGDSARFVGKMFTNESLRQPIGGKAAVPEPSMIAGVALSLGVLGVRWVRKQR